MDKFVFKLEPLFDYRIRLEEICKKEFSSALKKLEEEEAKLELIKEVFKKSSKEIDEMKENDAPIEEFSIHYAYIMRLKTHMAEQEKIISDVRAEFESKRKKLGEAAKSKKVVESIREKSYGIYMDKSNKAEQKASDDLTSSRFRSRENS